jgi:hypothetical protein
MKILFLSICLMATTCYGELFTLIKHQIQLTDHGFMVEFCEDYYTADYVIYIGDGMYLADIYPMY